MFAQRKHHDTVSFLPAHVQGVYLNPPAVLCEHLEADGGPKDGKDCHEDDVHTHLPHVCHQVVHPAYQPC